MKALVISDTHIRKLEEVERLDRLIRPYVDGVDVILHAGDILISEALEHLESLKPTYAVAGNMDSPDIRWTLSRLLTVRIGEFRVGLTHGWGAPEGLEQRVRRKFDGNELDAIVFGHSHTSFVEKVDGILMINPGSLMDKRFADRNSLAVVTAGEKLEVELVELADV